MGSSAPSYLTKDPLDPAVAVRYTTNVQPMHVEDNAAAPPAAPTSNRASSIATWRANVAVAAEPLDGSYRTRSDHSSPRTSHESNLSVVPPSRYCKFHLQPNWRGANAVEKASISGCPEPGIHPDR